MKIRSIAASAFQLPNRRSFKWAGLNGELGSFVLVRIETDSGHVGYGEATPLPDWGGDHGRRSGETLASVSHLVNEVFAPLLAGTDPTAVQSARLLMDRAAVGNTYAKCAVDIALHDLWGKAVGLPVYRLLGGAVRADVEFAHMVGLLPDDHALEEAVAAVADGVAALQVKGGVDPARDIRLVRALRAAVGDGIRLRVDANQGYGHPKQAAAIVRRLEEAGATCVEQPTEGLAAMAEVTAAARIPVIADESCWTLHDAMELAQARGADCISIYLAKAGGFAPARAVADVAAARAMACDVNGSIESAIGNAANLHFALSHPAVTLASVIPVSAPAGRHPYRVAGRYYEDDVIREPFAVRGGRLLPLEAPGLGIDVDEAALARFRRR